VDLCKRIRIEICIIIVSPDISYVKGRVYIEGFSDQLVERNIWICERGHTMRMKKLHNEELHDLRFLVLETLALKIADLCDVVPYSLVGRYRRTLLPLSSM
jgi:hypothetical protein